MSKKMKKCDGKCPLYFKKQNICSIAQRNIFNYCMLSDINIKALQKYVEWRKNKEE